MAFSFEWLIDPISPASFFENYYERQPLVIATREPTKFQSLLTLEQIETYLCTASPRHDDVIVVDAARDIKPEDYSFESSDEAGRIDAPRVFQLYGTGATISLSALHGRLPRFAALCYALEQFFSHHVQANVYLSPPNAQGFKTHYDSHDVFVLQVFGSKLWTIYDTLIELPLHNQGFELDKHIPGPPTRDFMLKSGDVFYCPRGLFHSARSTNEASLHVTLGVIGKTWADVMVEAVSAACLESPAFRKNLPIGYANPGFDSSEAAATFRTLVETFARNAQVGPILQRLVDDFIGATNPDLSGCLQELNNAPPVSIDTKVSARPNRIYAVRDMNENIAIRFGSTTITLPAYTRDPVSFALSGRAFAVRDLPGQLDDAGKIVLVQRLIREGLLVRANGTNGSSPSLVN